MNCLNNLEISNLTTGAGSCPAKFAGKPSVVHRPADPVSRFTSHGHIVAHVKARRPADCLRMVRLWQLLYRFKRSLANLTSGNISRLTVPGKTRLKRMQDR